VAVRLVEGVVQLDMSKEVKRQLPPNKLGGLPPEEASGVVD